MGEEMTKLGPFDVVNDEDLPPDTIRLVSAAGPTVITARNVGSVELTEDTKRYAQGVTKERMRCAEIALDIWKGKTAKWAPWYKKVGQEIAREILSVAKEEEEKRPPAPKPGRIA